MKPLVIIKVFFTNRVVYKKGNQTTSKEIKDVSQKSLKEPGKIKRWKDGKKNCLRCFKS